MPGLAALPASLRDCAPVRTLQAGLQRSRLPHAVLFRGEDLQALEVVALAFASELLRSEGNPLQHPDCFTLRPAKKSRQIAVGKREALEPNTMRALLRDLNQSANQGGYKVALIYEADRMHTAAANAFLKTLEEPPRETVLLMLTTRPYDVLPTIRSRSFQFRIPARLGRLTAQGWDQWLADYQGWIIWLQTDVDGARREPDRAILQMYGLLARFCQILDVATTTAWQSHQETLPENLTDDELEATRTGFTKGLRDNMLLEIEEATRLAGLRLSHQIPFPAGLVARAVAELESIMGLLALNMRDEVALESFFIRSLRIWTTRA